MRLYACVCVCVCDEACLRVLCTLRRPSLHPYPDSFPCSSTAPAHPQPRSRLANFGELKAMGWHQGHQGEPSKFGLDGGLEDLFSADVVAHTSGMVYEGFSASLITSVTGFCTAAIAIFELYVEKNKMVTSFELYMVHKFSKVLSLVTFYSKHTRALTFENLCHELVSGADTGSADGDAAHDHHPRSQARRQMRQCARARFGLSRPKRYLRAAGGRQD